MLALVGELWSWPTLVLALAVAGEVLAVVFVYRVLTRGGSAASTLLWMVVILAAPWLGLIAYYLLPRRLQLRRLRRLQQRADRLGARRGGCAPEASGDGARHGLEQLLCVHGGLSDGNQVQWLPDGERFFERAAAAVRGAAEHVHCVVYILRPDTTGLRFLALLTEAASRGVQVRLSYDSFGSWGLRGRHLAELRAAGGRAEPFLPLLWKRRPFTVNLRNHRKLLVVDGEVAFLGGRNIADEYRLDRLGQHQRWLDAMVEVRGPAVAELQDVFVQDWYTASDEVLDGVGGAAPPAAGACRVGVVASGPDQPRSALWFAFAQAVGEASRSVTLSSPYLVLPETLLFALQQAAARGVQVTIYTNGPGAEAWLLYHAQRQRYRALLDAGVRLMETATNYNHAKLLVVDERTVFVGSANMDLRSANLNFELAVVALEEPALAADVLSTVRDRGSGFEPVTLAALPKNPLVRLLDGVCGLFAPLL